MPGYWPVYFIPFAGASLPSCRRGKQGHILIAGYPGGYTGHGSGEVMIGFTTANRIPSGCEEELLQLSAIPEHVINRAFLAAAEAEQEAILNSMTAAKPTRGRDGELYYSLAEYLNDRNA